MADNFESRRLMDSPASPDLYDLECEFLATGIEALTRFSQRSGTRTAPWTLTHDDVKKGSVIGRGAFSVVYRGECRGQIVAIKEYDTNATRRELFAQEVMICRSIRHPNIIELLGASSSTSAQPWFCECTCLTGTYLVTSDFTYSNYAILSQG